MGNIFSNIKNAVVKGVKDTGNAVKKGVVDTGHVVGKVADNPLTQGAVLAALMASGVGAPAAAAIMAATKGGGTLLAPGGNIGQAVTEGAKGAVMGAGAAKLGGVVKSGIGALTSDGSALDKVKALISGGAGGAADLAKSMFGGATGTGGGGGGGSSLIDKGLLAAAVASAASDKQRQGGLQDKAISYATDAYDKNAGMRDQGRAAAMNPMAPDLSSVFANPGNAYDAQRRGTPIPNGSGAPVSAAAAMTGGGALSQALGARVPMAAPPPLPRQMPAPPMAPPTAPPMLR